MAAVPERPLKLLPIPPLAASSLGTQLSLCSILYIIVERPCHVLPDSPKGKTKSTSLQNSHKHSLITEHEKLTGSQMTVIFLWKYIDNYRDTCYPHSFYSQTVLHPVNTDLCKIQLNETADILWLKLLDYNNFLNHLFGTIWKKTFEGY